MIIEGQPSDSAPIPPSDSAPNPTPNPAPNATPPVDVAALQAELATLRASLQDVNSESGKRRHKLKTLKEQFDEMAETNRTLSAQLVTLTSERDALNARVQSQVDAEKSTRETLLASMTEDDRNTFGTLDLAALRAVHAKLYTGNAPTPSQGDTKPIQGGAAPSAIPTLEAAIASGDQAKINAAFTAEMNAR